MQRKIILGIGAHPDDMDFTAAGSIAKWVAEGAKAYYLIATDGSKGSDDPQMTHAQLIKTRQEEQIAAGKILGLSNVFFLDHPDTELVADMILKEELVRYIRQLQPDTVITMNPTLFFKADVEPGFVNHTDHRAVGLATMDAVFPMARDRLTFNHHEKAGLSSHKVQELLFMNFDKPEYVVDITSTFDQKMRALALHKSQFADTETFTKRMEQLKKRAELFGKEKGYRYGENFTRIVLQ